MESRFVCPDAHEGGGSSWAPQALLWSLVSARPLWWGLAQIMALVRLINLSASFRIWCQTSAHSTPDPLAHLRHPTLVFSPVSG